jgi:acyl-CoA thioesterase
MEPATIASANAISMLRTLDIRLAEIGEQHAVMEVAVTEKHGNYYGGAHGGLIATLVDTVCFFPRPLLPSGLLVTTSTLNVNFVRPARPGDRLVARSELLHLGRRTASLSVTVVDGGGRLVAHGSATLMVLRDADGTGDVAE